MTKILFVIVLSAVMVTLHCEAAFAADEKTSTVSPAIPTLRLSIGMEEQDALPIIRPRYYLMRQLGGIHCYNIMVGDADLELVFQNGKLTDVEVSAKAPVVGRPKTERKQGVKEKDKEGVKE